MSINKVGSYEYSAIAKVVLGDDVAIETQKVTDTKSKAEKITLSIRKLYKNSDGQICYSRQGITMDYTKADGDKLVKDLTEVIAATEKFIAKNPLNQASEANSAYELLASLEPSKLAELLSKLQGEAPKKPELKKNPKNNKKNNL